MNLPLHNKLCLLNFCICILNSASTPQRQREHNDWKSVSQACQFHFRHGLTLIGIHSVSLVVQIGKVLSLSVPLSIVILLSKKRFLCWCNVKHNSVTRKATSIFALHTNIIGSYWISFRRVSILFVLLQSYMNRTSANGCFFYLFMAIHL